MDTECYKLELEFSKRRNGEERLKVRNIINVPLICRLIVFDFTAIRRMCAGLPGETEGLLDDMLMLLRGSFV